MNNDLYSPRHKRDITYYVYARQKTYLTKTEIYIPNKPYEKIEEGYEHVSRQAYFSNPAAGGGRSAPYLRSFAK